MNHVSIGLTYPQMFLTKNSGGILPGLLIEVVGGRPLISIEPDWSVVTGCLSVVSLTKLYCSGNASLLPEYPTSRNTMKFLVKYQLPLLGEFYLYPVVLSWRLWSWALYPKLQLMIVGG